MDLLFLFKKGVSVYLHPLTFSMEFIVIGIVLVGFSRRRKRKKPGKFGKWMRRSSGDVGVAMVIFGLLFLFLSSIKPVADPLVYMLEKRYPPLDLKSLNAAEIEDIAPEFIVVLAGGERFDPEKPPTSQLSYAAMARVNEGARLARQFPRAMVVFTGQPKEVRAMTEAVIALEVERDRVLTESESRDTKDHPRFLKPILGESRFFLVTSGTHMPRSMALFEAQGFEPVAASCDLWVWPNFNEESPYQWDSFIPKVEHLWMTNTATHEWLGIAWANLVEARATTEAGEPSESGEGSGDEKSEPSEPDQATDPIETPPKPPLQLPLPLPTGSPEVRETEKSESPSSPAPKESPSRRPVLL